MKEIKITMFYIKNYMILIEMGLKKHKKNGNQFSNIQKQQWQEIKNMK